MRILTRGVKIGVSEHLNIDFLDGAGTRPRGSDFDGGDVARVGHAIQDGLLLAAQGLKGQNFDRQAAATSQVLIDGTVYFQLAPVFKDDVITNVCIVVAGSAVLPTLSKVGVYDTAGNLLASSVDQAADWAAAAAIKSIALQTPYVVPADGVVYLAVVAKATTTLPTLLRGVAVTTPSNAFAGGVRPYASQAAQTDLPNPATFASSNLCVWMGYS